MKLATRRRLAAGLAATLSVALCVGLGSLVASPAAQAATKGRVSAVSPQSVQSNDGAQSITFSTSDPFPPNSTVTLIRLTPNGTLTSPPDTVVSQNGTPGAFNYTAQFTFSLTDPGPYVVDIQDPSGSLEDVCSTNCFSVLNSAPTLTSLSPATIPAGFGGVVTTFNGSNFTAGCCGNPAPLSQPNLYGTQPEILMPDGTPDNYITLAYHFAGPGGAQSAVNNTATTITREVSIDAHDTAGARLVRVIATDGQVADCTTCFTVQNAQLTSTSPIAALDNTAVRVTFNGSNIPQGTAPSLHYVGGTQGSQFDVKGTDVFVAADGSSIAATYDLSQPVPAAPGDQAYQPYTVRPDGTTSVCACRFSVQNPAPTATAVSPSSATPGSSQTVTITGTNFAQGANVAVSPAPPAVPNGPAGPKDVTVSSVTVVSASRIDATFQLSSTAAPSARDVTVTNTDGRAGTCSGCFTVGAAPSSPPASTPPPTSGPPASSPPASSPPASSPPASSPPASSAPPTSPPPSTANRYVALPSPSRQLDSRSATNVGTSPGYKRGLVVLDLSTAIPAGATSAVLNVTVTNPDHSGFVVVYPDGNTKPGTSNVNFAADQTQANEVTVRLPASRKVDLYVDSADVNLIADLIGYLAPGAPSSGAIVDQKPQRVFDTRNGDPNRYTGGYDLDLSSVVPSGTTSVVLNVTVTNPSHEGFVVVYPTGTSKPGTSNVNFVPGQTQANEVVSRLGTGASANKVTIYVDSAYAAVIVDLVGTVTDANSSPNRQYTALDQPQRILDTRNGTGGTSGRQNGTVVVTLPSPIPADATGVMINVTATDGDKAGFVTAYPYGQSWPGTSNVNFSLSSTQANEVLTGVSAQKFQLLVGGSNTPATDLVVDVVGYFTG